MKDRVIPYSKYAHIKYKNTDTTEHRVEYYFQVTNLE
jgi:hypothetical protein